jgi:hypothetical protein
MKRLKWSNWPMYQELTGNTLVQVDGQLSKVILKCGFSWSPAPNPTQPILLTPIGGRIDLEILKKLGFEFEEDDVKEPSSDNAYDYSGILQSAWNSVGAPH